MDQLHPSELVHLMALGGTGTGKTHSAILPLLRAMLRYQLPTTSEPKRSAMFIVDPKKELLPEVVGCLQAEGALDRLLHLGTDASLPPVAFFEPGDGLSSRDRVDRLNVVVGTDALESGDHAYWHREGLRLIQQCLELAHAYQAKARQRLLNELARRLELPEQEGGFWAMLHDVIGFCQAGRAHFERATRMLDTVLQPYGLQNHRDANFLSSFCGGSDLDQFQYRAQSAQPLLTLLRDEGIARIVDFEPLPDTRQPRLDLRNALDAGRVLLYQPEPVTSSEIAARAIKAKVFEAVKSRSDMERPVGIVVDEYQKFITCDAETGDATFLDTARAYRTSCVLATQSIGALRLALGSTARAHAAVEAIVANTPSKWFFGCKDEDTARALRGLIPALPNGQHILDARRLAGLGRGEAYWSLADGRWGRGCAALGQLL
jgi:hypothetical protein